MLGSTNHPWERHEESDAGVAVAGGRIERYTAAATLLIGDVVFFSAALTVNKSVTVANYQLFAGVVVGGTQTKMQVGNSSEVGQTAANVNEDVLVCVDGKAWVVADAAIAAPAKLTAGTVTAGRVDDSASATAGQIIGTYLQVAAAAGNVILAQIQHM